MMDPGQDLLLAALSESGICPNDLFDLDPQDTVPPPVPQQVCGGVGDDDDYYYYDKGSN